MILSIYQKPAENPLETSAVGFQKFPEVSGQSIIDGPHGSTATAAAVTDANTTVWLVTK